VSQTLKIALIHFVLSNKSLMLKLSDVMLDDAECLGGISELLFVQRESFNVIGKKKLHKFLSLFTYEGGVHQLSFL
jgi:hypothetical protein